MLRSDRGYVGCLSYNPVHGDYKTIYPHSEPYDLSELAKPIPGNWLTTARAVDLGSEPGRNWALFSALLRYAGSSRHSEADIRYEADRLYDQEDIYRPHYFSRAELNDVVKSVLRKRSRWAHRPSGWHNPKWLRKQATLGSRGGLNGKGGGRPRIYMSNRERQLAYREPTANTHGGVRPGAGRKLKQSSVTKQANTDRLPRRRGLVFGKETSYLSSNIIRMRDV